MADKHTTGMYCFLGGLGVGLAGGILFAPLFRHRHSRSNPTQSR